MLQSMSTINATCPCHEDGRGRWERQREILQSSLWPVPLTAPPTWTVLLLHLNGLAPSLGLGTFPLGQPSQTPSTVASRSQSHLGMCL